LFGGEKIEDMAEDLFGLILRVASGEARAKSEKLRKNDFAIFKYGVTL